jgi:hypothetical protein
MIKDVNVSNSSFFRSELDAMALLKRQDLLGGRKEEGRSLRNCTNGIKTRARFKFQFELSWRAAPWLLQEA